VSAVEAATFDAVVWRDGGVVWAVWFGSVAVVGELSTGETSGRLGGSALGLGALGWTVATSGSGSEPTATIGADEASRGAVPSSE
jgi:hypothetical protein